MSKEAMKLALEALEGADWYINQLEMIVYSVDDAGTHENRLKVQQAITAIREALAEQPAQQWNAGVPSLYPEPEPGVSIKATYEQPAQQQEPEHIVHSNGRYSPLLTHMMNKRAESNVKQVIHLYDESCPQPAQQEPVRVPVTDNTYNYAKSLAEAIFKQHFASDEHYSSGRIVWGVNDTVIGILTQIDNMVADMVRKPAQQELKNKCAMPEACPEHSHEFYTQLKKPQQEPVASIFISGIGEREFDDWGHELPVGRNLLYTSPPAQRTWFGLTDAEWMNIVNKDQAWFGQRPEDVAHEVAKLVEAKLKEKNNV